MVIIIITTATPVVIEWQQDDNIHWAMDYYFTQERALYPRNQTPFHTKSRD